jgi:hypothetical protein
MHLRAQDQANRFDDPLRGDLGEDVPQHDPLMGEPPPCRETSEVVSASAVDPGG